MPSRFSRETLSFVAVVSMLLLLAPAVLAEESLRIARPQRNAPGTASSADRSPSAPPSFEKQCSSATITNGVPLKEYKHGSSQPNCCESPSLSAGETLTSSLPSDGLFARWRAEFVNPTTCPIYLCHGSCAGSQMSCKTIKTRIDSLLDAFIPEEPSVETVLNFRCCAGFTED